MVLQIIIKNLYWYHWSDNTNLIIKLLLFFFYFFTKKCVKIMTMLRKIFNKRIIHWEWNLFIFDTKRTLFSYKVRHLLSRREVCRCLIAKHLFYTYPLSKNKESLNFLCLFSLRALFLWSFPPCLVTNNCSALGEEAGDLDVPARGPARGRMNSRLED